MSTTSPLQQQQQQQQQQRQSSQPSSSPSTRTTSSTAGLLSTPVRRPTAAAAVSRTTSPRRRGHTRTQQHTRRNNNNNNGSDADTATSSTATHGSTAVASNATTVTARSSQDAHNDDDDEVAAVDDYNDDLYDDNDDDGGAEMHDDLFAHAGNDSASSVVRRARRRNMDALLQSSPSPSPRLHATAHAQLLTRLQRQRDELRALRDDNVALRAREVQVSALALRLQEHFAKTQSQVENIKAHVHAQLSRPIADDEAARIEALPDGERDLLDTVKLGIHRQLHAAQASCAAATRRAAELATRVTALSQELSDVRAQLSECAAAAQSERAAHAAQLQQREQKAARVLELEATVHDLQTRLRGVYVEQEQLLSAKLTAQLRTDEVAKLGVRVEELEVDVARHKTSAECAEQKLDILKSEFYELKLQYAQRVTALEAALRASEEKLRGFGDLELESELFISNMAQQQHGEDDVADGGVSGGGGGGGGVVDVACWLAMPRSRKLAHTLRVTKRCLHLENKTAALTHELAFRDKQLARLQLSLEAARDALNNVNSPYALVERTVTTLQDENTQLHEQVRVLNEDNRQLREALQQRTADVQTLCRHRKELLRMRRVLQHQLGLTDTNNNNSNSNMPADDGGVEASSSSFAPRRLVSSSTQQQQQQQQPPTATLMSAAATHATTTASTRSTPQQLSGPNAAAASATTMSAAAVDAVAATTHASLGSPLHTIQIVS